MTDQRNNHDTEDDYVLCSECGKIIQLGEEFSHCGKPYCADHQPITIRSADYNDMYTVIMKGRNEIESDISLLETSINRIKDEIERKQKLFSAHTKSLEFLEKYM